MSTISITAARDNLYKTVDQVNAFGGHVLITNTKGKNAVLMSEEDYNAIMETLYLSSLKGTAEKIIEGMAEPMEECLSEDEVDL